MSSTLDRNPQVNLATVNQPHRGFTADNTSNLTDAELVALNRALRSLVLRGLSIRQGKEVLQEAVAEWLHPADANKVSVERLLGAY